ncbi:unnamed protein product [Periconia digitata]|uniref:Uncharacterized protein n=1 Tax=Periconia digitata TaxID=1303443 RepID=A0A9W4UAW3_9PLEO|nr:unnamed protein product [Periconia digitata]
MQLLSLIPISLLASTLTAAPLTIELEASGNSTIETADHKVYKLKSNHEVTKIKVSDDKPSLNVTSSNVTSSELKLEYKHRIQQGLKVPANKTVSLGLDSYFRAEEDEIKKKKEEEERKKAEEEKKKKEEEEKKQKEEDKKNGVYDRKGNVRVTFKKETMSIANIELDEIFKRLREACHTTGQCETNDIVIKGQDIGKGRGSDVKNVELTLEPQGSYRESHRDNLLTLLEAAVREVAVCEEYTHTSTCSFTMGYCPSRTTHVKQCKVPAYWGVNIQKAEDKDEGSAPPSIGTNLDLQVVGDTICQDTYKDLAKMGKAVHSAVGGVFSLWQFACI